MRTKYSDSMGEMVWEGKDGENVHFDLISNALKVTFQRG